MKNPVILCGLNNCKNLPDRALEHRYASFEVHCPISTAGWGVQPFLAFIQPRKRLRTPPTQQTLLQTRVPKWIHRPQLKRLLHWRRTVFDSLRLL